MKLDPTSSLSHIIRGEERKLMDKLHLEQLIINYLKTIPAHSHKDIKICLIEPTLKGLHISWKQCGEFQRYGRIIKWEKLAEITKEED